VGFALSHSTVKKIPSAISEKPDRQGPPKPESMPGEDRDSDPAQLSPPGSTKGAANGRAPHSFLDQPLKSDATCVSSNQGQKQ
jgi:hypothetical protein